MSPRGKKSFEASGDTVTINNRPVTLQAVDVPVESIALDPENPRIKYRLSLETNGKSLEEVILEMPEVRALRKDILSTGGLRERILVSAAGKGKFIVREGNCRLTCYKSLHEREPDNPNWADIPAKLLPDDLTPVELAILLSDYHVGQKIPWDAHEKAGYVTHMATDLAMKEEDIALILRTSKAAITRLLRAYKFMVERFFTVDDGKYAALGERKWSFFDELYKHRELVEEMAENPTFGDQFCRWVGEGVLPRVTDVRNLPALIKLPEARAMLENGNFIGAMELLDKERPAETSDFFRDVRNLTQAARGAAPITEILRIQTDKVAQELIDEHITAFRDLKKLAGIPESQEETRTVWQRPPKKSRAA